MAIAGRVAIVPKGDWSADATYKRLDAVTYNNALYFAKKEVPAGTATSNTEYWSKSIVGGAGAIATTEEAGIVKPDGKSMSVDESGTLSINLDGTTITLDEAKNVIKLADALKDKIGSALQPESIVSNLTTTEAGFALDARQANPNVDGTLAKQLSDLNGSLIPNTNALFTVQPSDYFEIQYLTTVKIGNFIIASLAMHILSNMSAWGQYRIATANSESIRNAGIGLTMSQGTGKAYCLTGGRGYDIDIRTDANPPQNDDWLRGLILFYQS